MIKAQKREGERRGEIYKTLYVSQPWGHRTVTGQNISTFALMSLDVVKHP